MPFRCRISPPHEFAIVQLHGDVWGPDIQKALTSVLSDSKWDRNFTALWDLREVGRLVLRPDDFVLFSETIEEMSDHIGPSKTAVVAQRHLHNMAAILYTVRVRATVGHHDAQVYTNYADALKWLGKSPAVVEEVMHTQEISVRA